MADPLFRISASETHEWRLVEWPWRVGDKLTWELHYVPSTTCTMLRAADPFEAGLLWSAKRLIEEATAWKDAVLDELAVCCMDAPIGTPARDVLKQIIHWHIGVATDPAVNGGFKLVHVNEVFRRVCAGPLCDMRGVGGTDAV